MHKCVLEYKIYTLIVLDVCFRYSKPISVPFAPCCLLSASRSASRSIVYLNQVYENEIKFHIFTAKSGGGIHKNTTQKMETAFAVHFSLLANWRQNLPALRPDWFVDCVERKKLNFSAATAKQQFEYWVLPPFGHWEKFSIFHNFRTSQKTIKPVKI